MNQYKFRGLSTVTNTWVYGSLLQREDSFGPISLIEVQHKFPHEPEQVHVIAESVGMWTGLIDVNGKEIWEGDVYNSIHGKNTYKVMLVNGAFVGGKSEQSCMPIGWDTYGDDDMVAKEPSWLKVIGNIHEHPHLLNPAKGAVINTMNNQLDPNAAQQPANQEAIAEQAAGDTSALQAAEQNAQEKATESAEEGSVEG